MVIIDTMYILVIVCNASSVGCKTVAVKLKLKSATLIMDIAAAKTLPSLVKSAHCFSFLL